MPRRTNQDTSNVQVDPRGQEAAQMLLGDDRKQGNSRLAGTPRENDAPDALRVPPNQVEQALDGFNLLQPLGESVGYLKAGFMGGAGSGKTYTATVLAAGVREFFGDSSPLAFFDTETGSSYISPLIEKLTGRKPVGTRSRSFDTLMRMAEQIERAKIGVWLIDSVTHIWREVCDSYLRQLNESRVSSGKKPFTRLEFQHWAAIKERWQQWTDWYINSPVHVVICGRIGDVWEWVKDDETGRRELMSTGVKMKVEGEFGYEPALLVEMEQIQWQEGDITRIWHRATVLKDKFSKMNGAVSKGDPPFDFFLPHVEELKPGEPRATVDLKDHTKHVIVEDGNAEWQREKQTRSILCEEIQGELVERWPSASVKDKQEKMRMLHEVFGTRSWTAVEQMESAILRSGLERLRTKMKVLATPPGEQREMDKPLDQGNDF
jgi:hypothetical protein